MRARTFGLDAGRRCKAQIFPSLLIVPVEAVVFGAVRVECADRLGIDAGRMAVLASIYGISEWIYWMIVDSLAWNVGERERERE